MYPSTTLTFLCGFIKNFTNFEINEEIYNVHKGNIKEKPVPKMYLQIQLLLSKSIEII